ncbi:DUF6766 family protein [Terricaulis sp.]|uniref:DUF6766 family protein n=1 Tax=Terricaulis sp. TaxID=2768686 RepID=UPI002AC69322|nr:DUF6766 family protein [Terricaulis sp.]MDZ4690938.1 DUF6766 family protein [Terricaulis sp.]
MRWVRDNGLSIALLLLFAVSVVGHALSGWIANNEELVRHSAAPLTLSSYLSGGEFNATLFENWESEFLQMWAYVMLTAYLFQRGSPESKNPDESAPQDRDPKLDRDKANAPWPVRIGGMARVIYAHSLGWALLILFLASFTFHWLNSTRLAIDEALQHGETPPTLFEHLGSAALWFESFQNWQSEFLSTAVLILLAIYLREKGSPESKPVSAAHSQTGTD